MATVSGIKAEPRAQLPFLTEREGKVTQPGDWSQDLNQVSSLSLLFPIFLYPLLAQNSQCWYRYLSLGIMSEPQGTSSTK